MVLKLFGLKRKAAPAAEPTLEFVEVAPSAAAPAPKEASNLTPKQRAQRKYAAGMKQVRKRAATAKGGKGRIAKRSGAVKLRRELGLKPGGAAKKSAKAKSSKKKR